MSIYKDWALYYASVGWRVFPLQPGTKEPFAKSHGCHDGTTDATRIEEWWLATPDANVGLATGEGSGVVVLDLDVDAEKGVDGCAAYQSIDPALSLLSGNPHAQTPRGGLHLYLRHPGGTVKNSAGRIAPGVDTRGDGGYVVAPPSVLADGRSYRWAIPPGVNMPADVPAWLMPGADGELPRDVARSRSGDVAPSRSNLEGAVDVNASAEPPAPMEVVERCKRYLATIPDAVSGSGGHSATLRAAAECFRFGLSETDALGLLQDYNARRCHPKWSDHELRHKLKEGRKIVEREGKVGAHLLNDPAPEPYHHVPRVEIVAELPPEPADEATAPKPIGKFPEEWLSPPGLLGEICRYINETAHRRQEVLTLANSIAFLGAVFGRKVQTATRLRTNFYCLGVGESGCGKDHSRKMTKDICAAAGIDEKILGGEEVSSDAAIERGVKEQPSILYQFDEIGHLLSQLNSRNAATHQMNIAPTLTKLFTSADVRYVGKDYANKEGRVIIPEPNVCLYGTTVPDKLYDSLVTDDIRNGFLGRMLVFRTLDADPRNQLDRSTEEPPPAMVERIREIWTATRGTIVKGKNMTSDRAQTVPFTPDAASVMAKFAEEVRVQKQECQQVGLSLLWARASEHADKVSLLLACGNGQSEIDHQCAQMGVTLVRYLTRCFIVAVGNSVSDTPFGRAVLKVKNKVIGFGAAGVSRSRLSRLTRGMSPREREEVLKELLTTKEIEIVEIRTGARGPAKTVFRETMPAHSFN